MPNVTTPIPKSLTGNTEEDLRQLREWGTALIDELTYLFQNLDAGNVIEAASVKAENIDTRSATIENAQIGDLSADKLVAGRVDTEKVLVSDGDKQLEISGSEIIIRDENYDRFLASYDKGSGKFQFFLCNEEGKPTVAIDSDGNAIFSGQIETSSIYASTIVGTGSVAYENKTGGVFAQMDPDGIKIMQDQGGVRKQKVGMSVGDDGSAYLVLGAGNGENRTTINGVVYTNGSFKIQKNNGHANMGLVGYAPFINFWESSGELWLSGNRVLVNGIDVASKILSQEEEILSLRDEILSLQNVILSLQEEILSLQERLEKLE